MAPMLPFHQFAAIEDGRLPAGSRRGVGTQVVRTKVARPCSRRPASPGCGGARLATGEDAELLDEEPGAALLTMRRTTYDDTGRVVEYGWHVYRASRYSFSLSLTNCPRGSVEA